MLLEAQVLIASSAAASEFPTTCTLPDRVERVRWFLLPTEAWEYFHGGTDPALTSTAFTPRSYRQKIISTKQEGHSDNHGKTSHDKTAISQNKSFTLHIREELSDEESDSSASRAMYTEWVSMDALDRGCYNAISTSPSCEDPVTSGKPYTSCEDLGGPRSSYSRKERKKKTVKNIKKKLKSFLWPSRF